MDDEKEIPEPPESWKQESDLLDIIDNYLEFGNYSNNENGE